MQYRQINVRSPFYVQMTTSQPVVRLSLSVWLGDVVTDRPTDATFTLEKISVDGKATFEIAELVRDYIEQTSDYSDGVVWVETILSDFTLSPTTTNTYLATEGYETYRQDMSHNNSSWSPDFVMLPKDRDGNYRITGAKGELSKFQVLANSTNSTDWSYDKYDTEGIALVAEAINILPYSEDFNQWQGFNAPQITSGAEDPNGGITGSIMNTMADNQRIQYNVGILQAVPHTQSLYVKYISGDVKMELNNSEFGGSNVFLITSSGVVAETPDTSRAVESIGNDWYRISVTYTPDGTSSSNVHIYGDLEVIRNKFYIYGAQLELGSSTDDYIQTSGFNFVTQPPSDNIAPSTSSSGIIRTFNIGSDVGRVDFDLNGEAKTVYHDVFGCNKYNIEDTGFRTGYAKTSRPVILSYVNKHGAKNTFAFTLKHTQEMRAKSDSFERNVVDYTNLSRNKNTHSTRKIIRQTKQTFTINTDFISEYYVEQLEELLLSEYVWALNPIIDNEYVPVMITDKNVLKKNHLNDKLIQYTISYEVASNFINTTR